MVYDNKIWLPFEQFSGATELISVDNNYSQRMKVLGKLKPHSELAHKYHRHIIQANEYLPIKIFINHVLHTCYCTLIHILVHSYLLKILLNSTLEKELNAVRA